MQVNDLIVQYQNNLASGSEISTKTKGVEQLVETVKQLRTGNIFEGTINSVRGSQVILGLSSGQNITARLDASVVLEKGQSVFFQVKSNDGEQIQIKPVSLGGSNGNPTLMQALDAAGLAVNEKNLNMVNTMMKEQMSIDARSLQTMARQLTQAPGASADAVVEMNKLSLPVTEANVNAYENYKADCGQIVQQMNQLIDLLPTALFSEESTTSEMASYHATLVGFFTDGLGKSALADVYKGQNTILSNGQSEISQNASTLQAQGIVGEESAAVSQEESVTVRLDETSRLSQIAKMAQEGSVLLADADTYPQRSVGSVLTQDAYSSLQRQLSDFPEFIASHPSYFDEMAQLDPCTSAEDLMRTLSDFFSNYADSISKESLSEFLSDDGYKNLLRDLITKQWSVQPEDLTKEHTVQKLYEQINAQLRDLAQALSHFPKAETVATQSMQTLSQNIEFMNAMSSLYQYVQVPVRLHGQNVNSELFVYRNSNASKDSDDAFTAFLRFGLDHLGDVDISVTMQQKNVSCDWVLSDPSSIDIISENMHLLTRRLEEKGYHCNMQVVESTHARANFIDTILEAETSAGSALHRYSFDVRA